MEKSMNLPGTNISASNSFQANSTYINVNWVRTGKLAFGENADFGSGLGTGTFKRYNEKYGGK